MSQIVRHTYSVCPICLKRLPADIVKEDKTIPSEKRARSTDSFRPSSGGRLSRFRILVRRRAAACRRADCPEACGLCEDHLRKTCCALVEVTGRCNLKCP